MTLRKFKCWDDNEAPFETVPDDAWEAEAFDAQHAAQEYAEYSWNNRDGWEWLRDGAIIFVNDGETSTRMEIDVAHEPVFYAHIAPTTGDKG